MSRNKKGVVYRLTMLGGFALIGYQAVGEVSYYKYMRKDRDEEISSEKEDQRKIARFEELSKDEQDEEELSEQMRKDVEAAKQRKSWLNSREDYKQQRLEKILAQKNKAAAPTIDEIESKPTTKQIRAMPLTQRGPEMAKEETRDAKDSYI